MGNQNSISETVSPLRRKASELMAKIKNKVVVEVVPIYRHWVVRIYGGVVPGMQAEKFDNKPESVDWAVSMYGFYGNMDKTVDLKII